MCGTNQNAALGSGGLSEAGGAQLALRINHFGNDCEPWQRLVLAGPAELVLSQQSRSGGSFRAQEQTFSLGRVVSHPNIAAHSRDAHIAQERVGLGGPLLGLGG